MKRYECETQQQLDAAIAKAKANDLIVITGKGLAATGSATVTAYGSATVTATGSATVTATGSATVTAYGSATVTATGSATVTAYGSATVTATPFVAVHNLSPRATISGGVVITPPSLNEPKDWCGFYGITPKRGSIVVFKAVGKDFRSGHGTVYAPGTKVTCDDWADTDACGNGLHFSPRPFMALRYNLDASRFVACRVKFSEVRTITDGAGRSDKLKAPRCTVLYECDEDGNEVGAGYEGDERAN